MGEVGRQAAKAAGAAEKATESRGFVLAARVGFVAAGLLHVMIGVIALRIASGGSGTADQSGAIQELATTPGGGVLLWICFLGCVALALCPAVARPVAAREDDLDGARAVRVATQEALALQRLELVGHRAR